LEKIDKIYFNSNRFSLPNIKKDEKFENEVHSSNSMTKIDQFQTNKHVQFSENIKLRKQHSVPININFNDQSKSLFHRKLSISGMSSSSSNSIIEEDHASSISLITSSTNKLRLSSLEFHSSLTDFDRTNFDDIRQIVPDEFEKLIPILIKLGVIIIPKKFFQDNNQQLTRKEFLERHHLILLIKQYEENIEYKYSLQRLYERIFPSDNIPSEDQSLRETLSFQGQLALLASYQDEIERLLNQKMNHWKRISIYSNSSEYSYSTNKSSLIQKKFLKKNSSIKSNPNSSLTIDLHLIPDQIDYQWKQKLISFIIEQEMILLDQIRSLFSNEQFLPDSNYDTNKLNLVQTFKRWTFLSSILYSQQK
jgi:hypothetical protein